MDYEKKYNEALKWMRELYPGLHGATKEDAEHYFPELRESEDERIMKKMIEHFKSKTKDTWCNMPVKSILDWLEKQKVLTEHKEGIYLYYRDGTFTFISPPAVENPHNFTVPKPNEKPVDYDHEMWKNCEANFEGGKKEVIDHPEKYGLQKPVEWNDADMREARYNLISCCLDWEKGERTTLLPIVAVRARYFLEHYITPPAEWSEEDEKILDSIINIISGKGYQPLELRRKQITFLKSIRPHWKPNDEDEVRLINTTISFLDDFKKKGYENAVECIDWLKSKLNGNTCK